ncbi:SymE family type I addiction module toxin [Salmonella enterica subsp. enterica]
MPCVRLHLYNSNVDFCSLCLHGEWIAQVGFINGMPVKLQVMQDCNVITPQHTREFFGCVEGLA